MKVMKDTLESMNSESADKSSLLANVLQAGDAQSKSQSQSQAPSQTQDNLDAEAGDSLMGQRFSQVLSEALGTKTRTRSLSSSASNTNTNK